MDLCFLICKTEQGQQWWLNPVILAIWEAENRSLRLA
jgi:hypothetical protein